MAAADCFVILTRCQFNREHYQHRFKYQDHWYTMGVKDVKHADMIASKRYAHPLDDWAAIKRRLPQFRSWFERFDALITEELWLTNSAIIHRIARTIYNIDLGRIIMDPIPSCTGTDRLVEICRALNADTYLAGRSGATYMDLEKFQQAGIKVEFQEVTDTRHVFEP